MQGAGQPAQAGLAREADINLAGSRRPGRAGLDSETPGAQGSKGAAGRRPAIGWQANAQALAVKSVWALA